MALLLTSVTFGQETCNNVFDYNDNNTIDIEDFLAILGLFADVDLDDDGTWDSLDNCLDLSACNYASELNEPCTYLPPGDCDCNGNVLDECGVCGGTGLAPGTCDCNGTLIDVIGVCGGDCWSDEDADGICDDVDECVGEYDACNVCNGPGAIYECGCANIPEGECDCDGNVLDAIGVCGGTCSADEDADGVCDDVDDCVGEFDVCGVCNGPGEVYECGCGDVPEGECDCEGNVLDALGECGGECLADEDGDGVCDDVDDCVGEFDECGVCNGDGAVYECGCNDIPEGECDCDGNVFDECGVCNGPGPTEIVIEDIVTYYDSVYLPFDDAWYVYPVDADTSFGFTCAPSFQSCGDPVSYQGYEYATVQIGEQCWFAENLRSENYENGDSIPQILQLADWVTDFAGVGATTLFGSGNIYCEGASPEIDPCNSSEALQAFGRLYNWHAVNDERGLCPQGWHIPLDEEWTSLENGLGGSSIAGGKLKANFGWTDGSGTNESGFYALPGGQFYSEGFWNGYGNEGLWWSSTVHSVEGWDAWSRRMYGGNNGIYRVSYETGNALSVRCIQDYPEVLGCTDSSACNFNELANTDDGSCEYESCVGCTEPTACNYNPDAIISDDAICEFSSCLIVGCTIPVACNYNPDATIADHQSCDFISCQGCTDPEACNYDATATIEDGSCGYESCYGCMDEEACNYDATAAIDDGSCEYESCAPMFETCGDLVSYQGYDYSTVQIGEQCWFAENLRNEQYANGDSIPSDLSEEVWSTTSNGAVAIYGDEAGYCDHYSLVFNACDELQALEEYGRLYNWFAVVDARNLCPSGWHVSTDEDWMDLEIALGMNDTELNNSGWRGTTQGSQLKATYGWDGGCNGPSFDHECNGGGNGTNSTGFSALPGGRRGSGIQPYDFAGGNGMWWSPVSSNNSETMYRMMDYGDNIYRSSPAPAWGYSVRCIQSTPEVLGCIDPSACNYNLEATQNDGSCEFASCVVGCMIEIACNYNPEAALPDNSCDFISCQGCTDTAACNYDTTATIEDGSCEYDSCPSFEACGDPMSYQGYDYATVQIGNQCWFAENLRSESYSNGDAIEQAAPYGWDALITVYGTDIDCSSSAPNGNACDPLWSLEEYGRLYAFWAINDSRGVCPNNWHVPSETEWTVMTNYLGGSQHAGVKMKSQSGWSDNGNGNNESGFSGRPGGQGAYSAESWGAGLKGEWWTSSQLAEGGFDAYFKRLQAATSECSTWFDNPSNLRSVRCIQNTEE